VRGKGGSPREEPKNTPQEGMTGGGMLPKEGDHPSEGEGRRGEREITATFNGGTGETTSETKSRIKT
jgi:hypothetical protein